MLIAALETPRLVIRDVNLSDADAFYAYMRLESYRRHVPIDPPTPESMAERVKRWVEAQTKEPRTGYSLAVTDKATGQVIGEAILHIRGWREAEVGWGVRADRSGRGLGTEIGRAMLELAFVRLDLHRVFAQCNIENHASRRIMEKLGMREEGVLRDNRFVRGAWWSSVQYSILADEYAAANN
jgi:RimJ/RimL family protein N-acetyltransferase